MIFSIDSISDGLGNSNEIASSVDLAMSFWSCKLIFPLAHWICDGRLYSI